METAPKGVRLHIGLFGRRNVGKSSVLNAIVNQHVSIVSDFAGTTTDPVEKPMELLPLGPVLFIDTAGLDDVGSLGEMRIEKTKKVFDRTDLALIITDGEWGEYEEKICTTMQKINVPIVALFNKSDVVSHDNKILDQLAAKDIVAIKTSVNKNETIELLRNTIVEQAPNASLDEAMILSDLVGPGEIAVLVVPIDKEAPKGRLILPQVQAIRDLLDGDAITMVVKERELHEALKTLNKKPKLVVTDSQAFLKAAADTPDDIMLTSFSILFSRFKGDLSIQAAGAAALNNLKAGDKVLIAESCSHKPICEDIGRVKIPRWITQFTGNKPEFEWVQGQDWPEDLSSYKLVIHCGACMFNRKAMMARIQKCNRAGVPVTNYGIAIAHSLGILERALQPFPSAYDAYRGALK